MSEVCERWKMKERKLTLPNIHITFYKESKTLPFYVDLRGNSYADLAAWEARKLVEFLNECARGGR